MSKTPAASHRPFLQLGTTLLSDMICSLCQQMQPRAMFRLLAAILGSLGRSWGCLGGSWGSLGEPFGSLRVVLGGLWSGWGGLGVVLGGLGELLGGSWGGLGGILGAFWGLLERSWDLLGRPRSLLGRSWGDLGASGGDLGMRKVRQQCGHRFLSFFAQRHTHTRLRIPGVFLVEFRGFLAECAPPALTPFGSF